MRSSGALPTQPGMEMPWPRWSGSPDRCCSTDVYPEHEVDKPMLPASNPPPSNTPLYRFFSGLAEHTFQGSLGVADPSLVDYIAGMLVRFVHCDAIYRVRDLAGRRLIQVSDMLAEAEARVGSARREVHRHIGDYTLFWSGVFPEALEHLQRGNRKDYFFQYCEVGKRAYYIASTIETEEGSQANEVLERLSHDFELCQYGLREVRREWERRDPDEGDPKRLLIN